MAKKKINDEAIEAEVVEKEAVEPEESKQETKQESKFKKPDITSETFSRIFYTVLLFIIGWVSLWVFCFVVIIQFGFLLITGQVNTNLKGFNKEVGLFLFDIIKFLSFQTNQKPFPFRDWPYDEKSKNNNNSELSDSDTVEVSK